MRLLLPFLLAFSISGASACAQGLQIVDVYPDKARYAPFEPVNLIVELGGNAIGTEIVSGSIWRLGQVVSKCEPVRLGPDAAKTLTLSCAVPEKDYQGYLVTVLLTDGSGRTLGERETAIDVSSDWKRFPRYGYLAHYNANEGTDPKLWMAQLNQFHINGLEFYDFQYRHDKPLAGTVDHPDPSWKDIAGRSVDGAMVRALIDQAHHYNMMAMAYNASYSAYDDVFSRPHDQFPLKWAIWDTHDGPRSAATAKNLELHNTSGWSTHRLYYMNQNSPGWQNYLFAQMHDLFEVYPFDGWHVDTFGERGGYAFDGSRVDYISGFRPFIDHASAKLHKRILFNAVGTLGQESIAGSRADFVYSELWEDNETFAGILLATKQVHFANPHVGYVIAAYVHKEPENGPVPTAKQFNMPSVLLTDAAIFASGASHIELGDGNRMLSREYFPADTRLSVSPALHDALRHYYDYLTAYENYLRDDIDVEPCGVKVSIPGQTTNPLAVPNTIWTIARRKDDTTVVHLINLLGSDDPRWRDVNMTRPAPPSIRDLRLQISSPENLLSVGWASPDVDGGRFHPISFKSLKDGDSTWIEFTLPTLQYWDTVFLKTARRSSSSVLISGRQ
jgi:dextranase